MATEISIEEAIEFARAHDNRSKYAKKRANQIDISNGKVTKTVHKDDAVAALVYSGNTSLDDINMETPIMMINPIKGPAIAFIFSGSFFICKTGDIIHASVAPAIMM